MRTAIAIVAALAVAQPAVARSAVTAPPRAAVRLGVASPLQAGTPTVERDASGRMRPVPGYKLIAGVILAGIAVAIVGLVNQDGTPDSN